MKRKLLIGSVLSLVFLYLALRDIQWNSLAEVFQRTRAVPLLLCVVFTLLGHYMRAFRWKIMMLPVKDIRTNSLFSATVIGLMANNLLPARLGEVVRAYVLGREEQVSRTASFASIVFERIVDVFTLLLLLWIMLMRIDGPPWLQSSGILILGLNIAVFVMILLMVKYKERCLVVIARLSGPLPDRIQTKIESSSAAFISGLGAAGRASSLIPIALTSILVWGFAILGTWFALESLDLPVPVEASLTLLIFVSLGTMIPSAPAYLGTFQYACIVALALYQIDKSEALAFSLLFHASQFLPTTLVGLFFMWKSQIRFGDLSRNR